MIELKRSPHFEEFYLGKLSRGKRNYVKEMRGRKTEILTDIYLNEYAARDHRVIVYLEPGDAVRDEKEHCVLWKGRKLFKPDTLTKEDIPEAVDAINSWFNNRSQKGYSYRIIYSGEMIHIHHTFNSGSVVRVNVAGESIEHTTFYRVNGEWFYDDELNVPLLDYSNRHNLLFTGEYKSIDSYLDIYKGPPIDASLIDHRELSTYRDKIVATLISRTRNEKAFRGENGRYTIYRIDRMTPKYGEELAEFGGTTLDSTFEEVPMDNLIIYRNPSNGLDDSQISIADVDRACYGAEDYTETVQRLIRHGVIFILAIEAFNDEYIHMPYIDRYQLSRYYDLSDDEKHEVQTFMRNIMREARDDYFDLAKDFAKKFGLEAISQRRKRHLNNTLELEFSILGGNKND